MAARQRGFLRSLTSSWCLYAMIVVVVGLGLVAGLGVRAATPLATAWSVSIGVVSVIVAYFLILLAAEEALLRRLGLSGDSLAPGVKPDKGLLGSYAWLKETRGELEPRHPACRAQIVDGRGRGFLGVRHEGQREGDQHRPCPLG